MNSRERVLAALEGHPVDRPPCLPITMQFAADLLGVPYREYETNYRALAEGQLLVAEEFDFDYVNTMSDPAREASDCGAAVEFFEDSPAALDHSNALLADKSKLLTLPMPDPLSAPRMLNGLRAVAYLKEQVGEEKIVEGWIEGPCAEAADLRGLNDLMLDFHDDPAFVRDLFDWVVELELRFAREQIRGGADVIGIGDAAASLVGPTIYNQFVWPLEKRLVDGVHALGAAVRLHICGKTRFALPGIRKLGAELFDLDFPVPMSEARRQLGDTQLITANLNPVAVVRNGDPETIHRSLVQCHEAAGDRFVIGAGCEIPRDTPSENLRALAQFAHEHSHALYATH